MTWYVNEYAVTREYGGPEEGGWWFDEGRFVKCHGEFDDEAMGQADGLADALEEQERDEDDRTGGLGRYRYSVLGGADTVFYVEDQPGRHFPREYPRYE